MRERCIEMEGRFRPEKRTDMVLLMSWLSIHDPCSIQTTNRLCNGMEAENFLTVGSPKPRDDESSQLNSNAAPSSLEKTRCTENESSPLNVGLVSNATPSSLEKTHCTENENSPRNVGLASNATPSSLEKTHCTENENSPLNVGLGSNASPSSSDKTRCTDNENSQFNVGLASNVTPSPAVKTRKRKRRSIQDLNKESIDLNKEPLERAKEKQFSPKIGMEGIIRTPKEMSMLSTPHEKRKYLRKYVRKQKVQKYHSHNFDPAEDVNECYVEKSDGAAKSKTLGVLSSIWGSKKVRGTRSRPTMTHNWTASAERSTTSGVIAQVGLDILALVAEAFQ